MFLTTNSNGANDLRWPESLGAGGGKEERALRMSDWMLQNMRTNIVLNFVNTGKLSSFGALVGLFKRNRTNQRHLLQEAETPEISHCKLGDSGKMGACAKV